MKHLLVSLWLVCLLMLTGCSDENKPIPAQASQSSPASDAKAQPAPPSKPAAQVPRTASSQQISQRAEAKRAASEVRASLSNLQSGGDVMGTVRTAWESFAFPSEVNRAASQGDLRTVLEANADSLITELRQPAESSFNNDALKRAAVGRLSLLTALFGGETSAASRYPSLISKASQREIPTSGDLLMLRITRQAVMAVESPQLINAGDFPSWLETASARNPACRAAVLVAFGSMKVTPEQQESFYRAYVRESNAQIARMTVEQIAKADPPRAITLIQEFQSSSPHATDLKPIFDQAMTSLQERTP